MQVLGDLGQVPADQLAFDPGLVPVRHLDTDDDTGHDDDQVDPDRGPFLIPEVLDHAAQEHGFPLEESTGFTQDSMPATWPVSRRFPEPASEIGSGVDALIEFDTGGAQPAQDFDLLMRRIHPVG